MEKQYALLRPDEDGECFRLLNEAELNILLTVGEEEFGVTHFVTEREYKNNINPMYWEEGWGMIMEIVIKTPKPIQIIEKYSID